MRTRSIAAAAAAVALAVVPALSAKDGWLDDAALTEAFNAKTVDGHYPNGAKFTESYKAGGQVYYSDEQRQSGGHWAVQDGTFCTIYDDDPAGGCFRVKRSGANCYEFYFVARTEQDVTDGKTKAPDWTAQAWVQDKPSTCVAGSSV